MSYEQNCFKLWALPVTEKIWVLQNALPYIFGTMTNTCGQNFIWIWRYSVGLLTQNEPNWVQNQKNEFVSSG